MKFSVAALALAAGASAKPVVVSSDEQMVEMPPVMAAPDAVSPFLMPNIGPVPHAKAAPFANTTRNVSRFGPASMSTVTSTSTSTVVVILPTSDNVVLQKRDTEAVGAAQASAAAEAAEALVAFQELQGFSATSELSAAQEAHAAAAADASTDYKDGIVARIIRHLIRHFFPKEVAVQRAARLVKKTAQWLGRKLYTRVDENAFARLTAAAARPPPPDNDPMRWPGRGDLEYECPSIALIFVRGTSEPGNVGVFAGPPFIKALRSLAPGVLDGDATTIDVQGLDYTASLWGYIRGGDNTGAAVLAENLTSWIEVCPQTHFALGGYSQGAMVIRKALRRLHGEYSPSVGSVVLFGDPDRGKPLARIPSSKVLEVCHPKDKICHDHKDVMTRAHLMYSRDAKEAAMFVIHNVLERNKIQQ